MPTRTTKSLTKKHIARLERERRQNRIIVGVFGTIVAIVLVAIGYMLLNEFVLKARQPVARVGEEKITSALFQARVRLQRDQIIQQYIQYGQFSQMFGMDFSSQLQQFEYQLSDAAAEPLGESVLNSMINETLLRNEAARLNITVSEDEIQARLEALFGYFPNGEPSATASPTEVVMPTISSAQAAIVTITPTATITTTPGLELTPSATATGFPTITMTPDLTTTATATLEPTATLQPTATPTFTVTPSPTKTATPGPSETPLPTATPITKEGFEESLATSLESFTKFGFSEADYRKLIELEILRDKVMEYVTADIKPFEEQVWARHILVEDEETAKKIYERLKNGEDFAVVAAEVSTDTSNKDSGGDLGWFGKTAMVAPFADAAFSQKVGEIGKPVQTEFGWHIIQVIGHEDRPLTAEEFDQAKQDAFEKWLSDLRAKAEEEKLIEIFDIWKERVPFDPTLEDGINAASQQ